MSSIVYEPKGNDWTNISRISRRYSYTKFWWGISSEHSYSEAKAYVSGMCMGVIETDVNKGHTIMRDYI